MNKIDPDGIGVFRVELALSEVQAWLVCTNTELEMVNGAMDEAASFAADNDWSYVLVKIVKDKAAP